MRVLFVGDIVGEPGRCALKARLPGITAAEKPAFIIANAENAAGGKGITPSVAHDLFALGIHALTLGNHTFDRKEGESAVADPRIVRPANYPASVPGKGWAIFDVPGHGKLALINLMGRVYLPQTDCPFAAADAALAAIGADVKATIVDFHAEVTSEKVAMGWYLDGKVSALVGTHTHVPTADERVLTAGTGYITDVGMTGPADGVIGMDRGLVLKKFLTAMPQHFVVSSGRSVVQGCIIDVDQASGACTGIRRFSETVD